MISTELRFLILGSLPNSMALPEGAVGRGGAIAVGASIVLSRWRRREMMPCPHHCQLLVDGEGRRRGVRWWLDHIRQPTII